MGSLRNPVGSLPSAVYWRRRVLVLLAVIAVLALILYACSGSGGGKKSPVANGKSTPAASQSSAPGASGGTQPSGATASGGASGTAPASSAGAPSGSAGASGGTAPGATGATSAGGPGGTTGGANGGPSGAAPGCQLLLTLSSQSKAYANGDRPTFIVSALNKGTADCDVDLGPKSLVLNIYSGSDRIWSSADCGPGDKNILGIAPNTAQTITYTWDRIRSAQGCPAGGQTAKLGMYYGVASLAPGAGLTVPPTPTQPQTFELKSGS